jgi:hypothetical protein
MKRWYTIRLQMLRNRYRTFVYSALPPGRRGVATKPVVDDPGRSRRMSWSSIMDMRIAQAASGDAG